MRTLSAAPRGQLPVRGKGICQWVIAAATGGLWQKANLYSGRGTLGCGRHICQAGQAGLYYGVRLLVVVRPLMTGARGETSLSGASKYRCILAGQPTLRNPEAAPQADGLPEKSLLAAGLPVSPPG